MLVNDKVARRFAKAWSIGIEQKEVVNRQEFVIINASVISHICTLNIQNEQYAQLIYT